MTAAGGGQVCRNRVVWPTFCLGSVMPRTVLPSPLRLTLSWTGAESRPRRADDSGKGAVGFSRAGSLVMPFRPTLVRVDPCSGFMALCSGATALGTPSPVLAHTGADFCNWAVSVAWIYPHL